VSIALSREQSFPLTDNHRVLQEKEALVAATETVSSRLLTVKEVAAILGTSEVYVRQLAREGKLRSVRLSPEGYHRFAPQELERFIADQGRAP
jgi:excisionase family DNA binding protein